MILPLPAVRACLGVVALLLALVLGCEDDENRTFTFLVISDTHVRLPGNPDALAYNSQVNLDNLEYMIDRINTDFNGAAFVIVTGDLVGTLYSDDPADYLVGEDNPAEEFLAIMSGLFIPWHVVLGNHDYLEGYDVGALEGITTDAPGQMEAVWERVLGIAPYYSFMYGPWRFIMLNSCRGSAAESACVSSSLEAMCTGSFDEPQLAWLETQLENPEPCFLFFHHPPVTDHNEEAVWTYGLQSFQLDADDRFYEIALRHRDRIKGIFVGHGHIWTRDVLHGTIPVYETGAIGDFFGSRENVHVVETQWDGDDYKVAIGNPYASYAYSPPD